MNLLPNEITKVHVPPIKIQGIKTKLIPFIAQSIEWNGEGTWYEPFTGSGSVGFNIGADSAVFGDNNPHIIKFYQELQAHKFDAQDVREFLTVEGEKLAKTSANKDSYYYEVRRRFNKTHESLDFLFLQRSNFNGMIRFGPNGYNVPFGRKPERFRQALITKICNQVEWLQYQMDTHDWEFICADWKEVLGSSKSDDFVYLDPPYIGRSTDYFDSWTEDNANDLANYANSMDSGYALSMWAQNKYRHNDHLARWNGTVLTNEHYYFLGGKETNRNAMTEALVVKQGYVAELKKVQEVQRIELF